MFYADLHIHSKFSRATSKDLDLENIALWGAKKGLDLISTGDFTHPSWWEEINSKLDYLDNGTFKLKDEIEHEIFKNYPNLTPPRFLLSVEISTIYKSKDKTRKVHHVVFCPDLESANKFRNKLDSIGNIKSDGRPILGLDSRNLLEITLESNEHSFIIPAHIWTPWFSVLGSKSGFDSIEECYEDLSSYIFALETGLSSDPYMNWRVSKLDRFRLVSNSDAHSPSKLAREATVFNQEVDYFSLKHALQTGENYVGTVEFYPEEGKYHADGHRKCDVCLESSETKKLKGICPVCGKPLTIGVSYRVEELSDRPMGCNPPKTAGKVFSLIPLNEIIAEIFNVGVGSKKVQFEYERLINKFGSELSILQDYDLNEIKKDNELLSIALERLRRNEVIKKAGFDGEYGVIKLFKENELESFNNLKLNLNLAPVKAVKKEYKAQTKTIEHKTISNEIIPDLIQKEAIEDKSKQLLIIAGPGAGKTTVLTKRIASLISNKEVEAKNCLAITFTVKAANEMKERLEKLINPNSVNIHTFHSLCYSILKEKGQLIGLNPDFKIITENEKDLINSKDALTFDDLILYTLELFKNTEIVKYYQNQFKYIFVDEYQDIDLNQYHLIKFLAPNNANITVIGDPNQAIYGFRGGSSKFFNNFSKDYPNAKIINLKNNYRSSANIVNVSNQIINQDNIIPKLNFNHSKTIIHCAPTDKAEAEFVVATIEKMLGGDSFFAIDSSRAKGNEEGNYSFNDFAILYRTKTQLRALQEALDRISMPYCNYSDELLINKKEIRDCLKNLDDNLDLTDLKDKIANYIFEFLSNLIKTCKNKEDFIHQVSFLKEYDCFDKRGSRINLMTLHCSKGLEFKNVFIVGLNEEILPFFLAKEQQEIEEERRLLYVGMTRAKENLILSYYNKKNGKISQKSRFLDRIEKELLENSEFKRKPQVKAQQLSLF